MARRYIPSNWIAVGYGRSGPISWRRDYGNGLVGIVNEDGRWILYVGDPKVDWGTDISPEEAMAEADKASKELRWSRGEASLGGGKLRIRPYLKC